MTQLNGVFGGSEWMDRVRDAFGSSLLGIYGLDERTGVVARQSGGSNTSMVDGVHNGPTLADAVTPFGMPCPYYDAIGDYTSYYQGAAWDAVAATLNEGTVLVPFRMANAGVWTDGINRQIAIMADSALNNRLFYINKTNTNNTLRITRTVATASANIITTVDTTGNRHLDWMVLAMTWHHANNRHRAWIAYRGVAPAQFGTTQTSAGAFGAVTLSSNRCALGTQGISGLEQLHSGWIGSLILGNRELDFATKLSPAMGFN